MIELIDGTRFQVRFLRLGDDVKDTADLSWAKYQYTYWTSFYAAKLKKEMTEEQKKRFDTEDMNRRPLYGVSDNINDSLPWEVVKEIADYVKQEEP